MNTPTKPTAHPRLAQLLKEGWAVSGEPRFYVSEAGLSVADVKLIKKGEKKPIWLNGIYGKDENVPGGRRHRFGKTAKDGYSPAEQKAKARAKSHNATTHHGGTSTKTKDGSAKSSGLGTGSTKKDHK